MIQGLCEYLSDIRPQRKLEHEYRPGAPESDSVTALPEFRLRAALTECMRIFSTKV